jgi:hypothetical protein
MSETNVEEVITPEMMAMMIATVASGPPTVKTLIHALKQGHVNQEEAIEIGGLAPSSFFAARMIAALVNDPQRDIKKAEHQARTMQWTCHGCGQKCPADFDGAEITLSIVGTRAGEEKESFSTLVCSPKCGQAALEVFRRAWQLGTRAPNGKDKRN